MTTIIKISPGEEPLSKEALDEALLREGVTELNDPASTNFFTSQKDTNEFTLYETDKTDEISLKKIYDLIKSKGYEAPAAISCRVLG